MFGAQVNDFSVCALTKSIQFFGKPKRLNRNICDLPDKLLTYGDKIYYWSVKGVRLLRLFRLQWLTVKHRLALITTLARCAHDGISCFFFVNADDTDHHDSDRRQRQHQDSGA